MRLLRYLCQIENEFLVEIFMLALNQLYEFLSFGYFYFYIFSHFASFDWNVYTLNLLPKREKLPPQNIDTITIYIFLSLHLPFFNLLFPSFPLSFLSYRLQFNARETRSNFERGKQTTHVSFLNKKWRWFKIGMVFRCQIKIKKQLKATFSLWIIKPF